MNKIETEMIGFPQWEGFNNPGIRVPLPENAALFSREVLGQPTDFLVTQKREGDQIKITVETTLPAMRWDAERQCLCTWAPPRYPWSA